MWLRIGIEGSGFGVQGWGLGFRTCGSASTAVPKGFRVSGFGFRESGLGFGLQDSGFGIRFQDSGLGIRVLGFGYQASDFGFETWRRSGVRTSRLAPTPYTKNLHQKNVGHSISWYYLQWKSRSWYQMVPTPAVNLRGCGAERTAYTRQQFRISGFEIRIWVSGFSIQD